MEPSEYQAMRAAEDHHWWYRGLHALVASAQQRHAPDARRWLDAGCGTGGLLAQWPLPGVGIDASALAVAGARARGLDRLVRGNVNALPFAARTFDGVLALDVLYHRAVDVPAALGELYRVAQPGAVLLVNMPADWAVCGAHDRAIHTGRRYTRRQLCGVLAAAGWCVTWATYWNAVLLPAALSARWLRRDAGKSEVTASDRGGAVGHAALALERAWLRVAPLPLGLSVFAVSRRE